ncbi:putative cytokinetic ring protein SteA [Garciella nitratireducens]|uniref:putative cytokinetic ring protein SteA n=1 Tax=Garciella nitratireducens TaxID=218205 RepID=UPI000DEB6B55|nr:putative cytokinetic ring protein SteA [Garciella nitratireducens]RBP45567.1 putative membrane-anchored protein [Garciella nitratireducens]
MIKGTVRIDKKTKELAKRIQPGEIAIINHKDIDEVAAESLVSAKTKLIINLDTSISGKYPNLGPKVLLDANISILDEVKGDFFQIVKEGDEIEIIDNEIYKDGEFIGKGQWLTKEILEYKINQAKRNLSNELDKFIENTLEYAKKEKDIILNGISIPKIKTSIKGRHVVVVVRGKNYKEDLSTLQSYIREEKPVLIGVDGGADALIEFGYKPNIIVGDMDSVSDNALQLCDEIIVHAYTDGRAPGMDRIKKLGLEAVTIPAPGTSEDIAMLIAHEKGADLIVALGSHSNMIDFLEKGRKGMASTFLVRLKVGAKLIDAKGVNKLYHTGIKLKYIFILIISALLPIIIIGTYSPGIQYLLRLLEMRLKILFEF